MRDECLDGFVRRADQQASSRDCRTSSTGLSHSHAALVPGKSKSRDRSASLLTVPLTAHKRRKNGHLLTNVVGQEELRAGSANLNRAISGVSA